MTLEDDEKRHLLGIKEEDIFYIPTAPLWELCRQFDEALPGQNELGKALYGFYCIRIKEIAKEKGEEKKQITNEQEMMEKGEYITVKEV